MQQQQAAADLRSAGEVGVVDGARRVADSNDRVARGRDRAVAKRIRGCSGHAQRVRVTTSCNSRTVRRRGRGAVRRTRGAHGRILTINHENHLERVPARASSRRASTNNLLACYKAATDGSANPSDRTHTPRQSLQTSKPWYTMIATADSGHWPALAMRLGQVAGLIAPDVQPEAGETRSHRSLAALGNRRSIPERPHGSC